MVDEKVTASALGHAFRTLLEGVPTRDLERFAERQNLLSGGYRKGGNPALLRTLVANAYASRLQTYSMDLATFCRTTMAPPRLTAMLAHEMLEERRYQFYAFFGKAVFLFSLLMDSREAVRTLATAWMDEAGAELPDTSTARDLLAQVFSPIVDLGQGGPAASAHNREAVGNLRGQLVEAEKALKQARRERDERIAAAQREMKSQLATAQFGIDERQRRIDQLEAQLKKSEATLEERVKLLLSVRQTELFQGWLKPGLEMEALVATDSTAPLLERAQAALDQQATYDRASALRATLETRLQSVEAMLATIDATLATATLRAPALLAVRQEVVAEQQRLAEILRPAVTDPLVQLLEARFAATTQEDYETAIEMLTLAQRFGLVGKDTAKRLMHIFHRRASVWSDTDPVELKDVEENPIERRQPALTAALRGQGPLLLFLDGHNLLNGLGRYKQRRGTAVTHEDARRRVEMDIVKLFCDTPQVSAHLVWDGHERSSHNLSDNVLVHYSGGEGEHRADRYIIDQLQFVRQQTSAPIVLVSDDQEFGGNAIKLGAAVCKLHDFEAFLNTPLR